MSGEERAASSDLATNHNNTQSRKLSMLTNAEIDGHDLLDGDLNKLCKVFRTQAKRHGRDFTMLDFAAISLRAEGVNYADAREQDREQSANDRELRKAAILYVYEALRASDAAIIKEWPEFNEMLRILVVLAGDLP